MAGPVRALFSEQGFTRLYGTRLVSQTADGVFQASLASAVLFNPEHATDPATLAAGFSIILLPYSVVGPFAGVFLDRWRRQRVLLLANIVRATIVVLAAALLLWQGPVSPAFYTAALAATSVNRFYLSALSAGLPHTVTPPRLVLANSVSTTSGTVVTFIGAGLALLLRQVLGSGDRGDAGLAVTAAVIYLLSSVVVSGFPSHALGPDLAEALTRPPLRDELGVVGRGLAAGGRHVWSRTRARNALLAIVSHRLFYGISTIATILLYRNYFHSQGVFKAGLPGLAEVFSASAIGVLLAAAVTPVAVARITKEAWIASLLGFAALVELALGTPYRKDLFVLAALLLGFVAQGSKICVDTIVQEDIDEVFLGRVFSVYDTLFNLTFVAAAVLSALFLPSTGKSYVSIAVITLGYALAAAAFWTASQRRRRRMGVKPLSSRVNESTLTS
ncbi:MFS transporter [Acidothermaceae bacterium B102]|nr:MFS transporter [Acidothermaceae bacterium B102]